MTVTSVPKAFVLSQTETALRRRVEHSKRPAIVLFRSVWSGPSRSTLFALEEIAREYRGKLAAYEIDMMDNFAVADRYSVRAAPTVIVFDRGRETARHEGMATRDELRGLVGSALADSPEPIGRGGGAPRHEQEEKASAPSRRRIVVGLDSDAARNDVLETLLALVRPGAADDVALVHALPLFTWVRGEEGGESWSALVRNAHQDAAELLREAAVRVSPRGARVETFVLEDDPVAALLSVSRDRGAGVIVVGALSPKERDIPMLGSVSCKVASRADANVLVVRPGHRTDPLEVVLAADESLQSAAAMDAFIQTIRTERMYVHWLRLNPDGVEREPADARTLDRCRDVLKRRAIAVSSEVCPGDPESGILDAAERRSAGLVVLPRGPLSDAIARRAKSSLLVTNIAKA